MLCVLTFQQQYRLYDTSPSVARTIPGYLSLAVGSHCYSVCGIVVIVHIFSFDVVGASIHVGLCNCVCCVTLLAIGCMFVVDKL